MKPAQKRRFSLRALAPSIIGFAVIICVALCRSHEGNDKANDDNPRPVSSGGGPTVVGRFEHTSIVECSGLVASRKNSGAFWIHNDSGDRPRLFAILSDGTVTHELEVTGAEATDWEDIAIGPGPIEGEPYLYVTDTGNNNLERTRFTIYRVPEPRLEASRKKLHTKEAARIVFEYERGRHDCEALVVHPTSGDIYLITKFPILAHVFYIPRPKLRDGERTDLLTAKLVDALNSTDLITGADLSADGRRLAVRSYLAIVEYEVDPKLPFGGDLRPKELRVSPHRERQSEAICFTPDGHILTTSEGKKQPIFRLERED